MPYDPANTAPVKPPMSKWWPIGIAITAIIFFAIGGGLAGAWSNSSIYSSCDSYYYYCTPSLNNSLWIGAIACLVIGGILKLAFWITLIFYCAQRRRARAYAAPYVQNYPLSSTVPQQESAFGKPAPERFCGRCGTRATGAFCTQCGSQV